MKKTWLRALLLGVALVIAGIGAFLVLSNTGAADHSEETAAVRRVPVVVTTAVPHDFEQRLTLQGNVEARRYALVSARIPGTVEELFVDEGDTVAAGETKLFQTDALKVRKAVDVAQQDLAIARSGLKEKEAYRERLVADFDKARIDYNRSQLLYESNSIAVDVLEQQRSRYLQSAAMVKHAQSLVELAQQQVDQAQSGVAIAEKDLQDATVVAEFSGTVTNRFLEPGEMADAGTPVLRIEDPTLLEVSAYVPAQYFSSIEPGTTRMQVQVYGVDVGAQVVDYRSPNINPKLRTFEVKCTLTDPPDGVVSGAIAEVVLLLAEREGLGVPREALQERGGNSVVFVVAGESASMLPVSTGFETDGLVEVQGEGIAAGTPVVTMGQFLLNDGTPVSVQRGEG